MDQVVKRRNIYLDLFKFFLVFLIITIHTFRWPFDGLFRLGVVMFFMITGFFMYSSDPSKRLEKAKRFIIRSLCYLLIALAIHLAYDIILILTKQLSISDYSAIFTNSKTYIDFFAFQKVPRYEHLWYLVALFLVSIFHYIFVRFKITSLYKWVVLFILVLSFFLFYSVFPSLGNSYRYIYVGNAYMMGLPMFTIGFILNQFSKTREWGVTYPNFINLVFGVIFFILQYTEMRIMDKEFFYSSILSSIFLLTFFTNLECKKNVEWYYDWIGKNATYFIYLLHIIVRNRLDALIKIGTPVVKPLIILVASFVIYEIGFLVFKLIKYVVERIKESHHKSIDDAS